MMSLFSLIPKGDDILVEKQACSVRKDGAVSVLHETESIKLFRCHTVVSSSAILSGVKQVRSPPVQTVREKKWVSERVHMLAVLWDAIAFVFEGPDDYVTIRFWASVGRAKNYSSFFGLRMTIRLPNIRVPRIYVRIRCSRTSESQRNRTGTLFCDCSLHGL